MNIEYEQFKKKNLFPYKNNETNKQPQQRRIEQSRELKETGNPIQYNVKEKSSRPDPQFSAQHSNLGRNSEKEFEREIPELIKLDSNASFIFLTNIRFEIKLVTET